MGVKQAVVARICELCEERGIKPNELATRSGVTPSTVYSLLGSAPKKCFHRDAENVVRSG